MTNLEGKVAIVTGAGKGLGRSEAINLAKYGATVIVNDVEPCKKDVDEVIDTIKAAGGKAEAAIADVGDFSAVEAIVQGAVDKQGGLDILVNNAGILRDRMIFKMSEQEFDQVIHVHLKGHFNFMRHATGYWREKSKAEGQPVYGRIINTASEAFLYGAPGQPNYAAAKAGIVAMTMAAAQGMIKYGVTANAICPRARTDMTKDSFPPADPDFDIFSTDNVAPLVTYLASPEAANISGYVFLIWGKMVQLIDKPSWGKKFESQGPWTAEIMAETLGPHFKGLKPIMDGYTVIPTQ